MKITGICLVLIAVSFNAARGQGFPWNNPLMITTSTDGITFTPPVIFQDSAGVPSLIRWHGDTLISAFQWFRQPAGSASWDRVAVKFSYDKGITWTSPIPIDVPDLPSSFQRPFDPTLVVADSNKIRIFFSSGPAGSLIVDSMINTYSAISYDGIHYSYEANPRFDHPTTHVIDPAVIFFHGMWHYLSPYSPPNIAYHAISGDGLNFVRVPDIISDMAHNWTGNYMVNDTGVLRFYGCGGTSIWYNHSSNGGVWDGYVNTNITGGDPAVVKIDTGGYLMVFTGHPYTNKVFGPVISQQIDVYPNPCGSFITIDCRQFIGQSADISVIGPDGKIVTNRNNIKIMKALTNVDLRDLVPAIYYLHIVVSGKSYYARVSKIQ